MATEFISLESILIQVLGICILLPLFVAVFFEPKRDYSRKTYLCMIITCAVILTAELLQWMYDGKATGPKIFIFKCVECVFYVFLVLLCYLWTLYSYYWFNRKAPKGKAIILFSIGPVLEVAALLINIITGFIYSVSDDGVYQRGPFFICFIGFCYIYLIIAIICTAIRAKKHVGRIQTGDISLFLMFFLFPIVGPVLQYIFPLISLLGISEAIALLTVFVSVQQRANAEYAIEKVRFQEDNLQYEKSLEELLTVSPDALCVFHLNLTKNTRSEEHGTSKYVRDLIKGSSVDELGETIMSIITDPEDVANYKSIFNRNYFLEQFSKQNTHFSLAYHRITDNGESHLIKTYLSMLKNPATGDIEAIVYSVDRDRQEKEEKVISALTNRDYDYIALIDVKSKRIHYQYLSEKVNNTVLLCMGDYNTVMQNSINSMHEKNQKRVSFGKITFDTVYEELKHQEEYSYVFSFINNSDVELQKRITYRYLDEKKNEILFFRIDITEEMRQEREHSEKLQAALLEAQHANAMKSEFLSNVSHDMRTPLNAVIGYTDLAKKSKDLNEIHEYLDKLERAGKLILSLVNDTLDLTKIESGVITLKPAPISCGEVIKKIISAVQPAIDEKHIHFVLDNCRAVMATINVDALRLQDIFINLLSNAIKFTPENGDVTLVVECTKLEPNCVHDRLIVRDTGCGMTPEFLPKAFEPFTQERFASTAHIGGSGLGLSIVKKLVEMMGGTISVKSELGKGTEFTVCLDLERVDDSMVKSDTEQKPKVFENLAGKKILLVEDNEMNTEIAKAVLEMKEMKVTCASNGQIACDMFAQSQPGDFDVILMDIRMPVLNGLDAAKAIRKMAKPDAATIPIIAMSANAFDDDIRASLDAGMNGHIAKPVNPEKLYEVLTSLVK